VAGCCLKKEKKKAFLVSSFFIFLHGNDK